MTSENTSQKSRKLILHIGAHKTGSSAIQQFLLRQKKTLANMNWFFCERHDRPTNWGHMFRIEREADGARFPLARVVMNRMLNLIDSNTMDVVFSAEDLFFLDDAEIANFCDAMTSRFST